MIWTPAEVGVVRKAVHRSGLGQVVVVPVASGTVVVPADPRGLSRWTARIRRAGDGAESYSWEQDIPEIGRPEVAEVAQQIDEGVFDGWHDPRIARAKLVYTGVAVALYLLLSVLIVVVGSRFGAPDWVPFVLIGVAAVTVMHWVPRLLLTSQPIDAVAPIVSVRRADD
jgi:hypothetical protein